MIVGSAAPIEVYGATERVRVQVSQRQPLSRPRKETHKLDCGNEDGEGERKDDAPKFPVLRYALGYTVGGGSFAVLWLRVLRGTA